MGSPAGVCSNLEGGDARQAGGMFFYINCVLAPDFRFGSTQIGGDQVGLEQPGVLGTAWRRCLDTSMMDLGIKHALGAVKPTTNQ